MKYFELNHSVSCMDKTVLDSSPGEQSERRISSCYLRDSVITRMRSQEGTKEDVIRSLFGFRNVLWVLFALYFLRLLVVRTLHGLSPVCVEFLLTSIYDAPKIILIFGLIWASSYSFFFILYLEKRSIVSNTLANVLLRVALFLYLVLPCKWVLSSEYPIVPSFSVAAQVCAETFVHDSSHSVLGYLFFS